VNPILAENMGRWAEVYFTSPPEKREEAVLELLRELEAGNSGRESALPTPQAEPSRRILTFPVEETHKANNVAIQEPVAACARCGHDNPVSHQFCGMCGFTLSAGAPQGYRTDSPYEHHAGEMESVDRPAVEESPRQEPPESKADEPRQEEYPSDPYDLSLLKGLRGGYDYEYEEHSSPRYRYYIGAVLAIVLLALGYVAWHGGQTSQNAHQVSPAPPPPVAENSRAVPASTPGPTIPAPSNQPKASEPAASASSNPASESPRADTVAPRVPEPSQKPLATATPMQASAVSSQLGSRGNSQTGSTAETVERLWSEVKRHNGPATVQLADKFLKGDGVSKNCDQARILLDTAAQRGIPGAGERLRNLQAFGCQ
jgi:hypothetical protein